MKFLNKVFLLLAASFTLFSCDNQAQEQGILYTPRLYINETFDSKIDYSAYSIDDYTVTINPIQLKDMLDNKESFAFLFHNLYCATCEKIRPLFIRYVLETKNTFYSLDVGNDRNLELFQIDSLYSQIKDSKDNYLFVGENGEPTFPTPEFYFIKDGEIAKKQLVTSNMFNYSFFAKVMNKYLITSNSYLITTLDDINKFRYIYYCDFNSTNKNKLYLEILSNKNISVALYRVDSSTLKSKIVDKNEELELNIDDKTTINDVLTFLNINT